jgi:hypothetical protein
MPAAWAQYLAELSVVNGPSGEFACSPLFLEIVGRESANIAWVKILKYRGNVDHQDSGSDSEVAEASLLKRLKGVADWNVGETREVRVWRGNRGRETLKLSAGRQLILFRGRGPSTETWTTSLSTCPIAWVNEANLGLIRRSGTSCASRRRSSRSTQQGSIES